MFIQWANNETTVSQLPWIGNDVPIPKTGQHKESFKIKKKINCYSVFIAHVVQYANMKEKIQSLSVWDVMSGSTRSAKKYHVKCLQTKQPIYFVKDAAKDIAN